MGEEWYDWDNDYFEANVLADEEKSDLEDNDPVDTLKTPDTEKGEV